MVVKLWPCLQLSYQQNNLCLIADPLSLIDTVQYVRRDQTDHLQEVIYRVVQK